MKNLDKVSINFLLLLCVHPMFIQGEFTAAVVNCVNLKDKKKKEYFSKQYHWNIVLFVLLKLYISLSKYTFVTEYESLGINMKTNHIA